MVPKLDYSNLSISRDSLEHCIAQHTMIVDLNNTMQLRSSFSEGLLLDYSTANNRI
jgi:hypothetical protein